MKNGSMRKTILALGAGALALGGLSTAAVAQRDPAYAAARAAGQVGEKIDGYLGIVGASTPELERVVRKNSIQRKALYTKRAQAQGATIEEYALTAGCKAIMATKPGEKYQAPDGTWQTRTSTPPMLSAHCPR